MKVAVSARDVDGQAASAAIAAQSAMIDECYRAKMEPGSPGGDIVVTMRVDGDGRAYELRVLEDGTGAPDAAECVSEALRRVLLPRPSGPSPALSVRMRVTPTARVLDEPPPPPPAEGDPPPPPPAFDPAESESEDVEPASSDEESDDDEKKERKKKKKKKKKKRDAESDEDGEGSEREYDEDDLEPGFVQRYFPVTRSSLPVRGADSLFFFLGGCCGYLGAHLWLPAVLADGDVPSGFCQDAFLGWILHLAIYVVLAGLVSPAYTVHAQLGNLAELVVAIIALIDLFYCLPIMSLNAWARAEARERENDDEESAARREIAPRLATREPAATDAVPY